MNIPKKIKILSAILSLLGLSLGNSLADGPAGVTDAALWMDASQLTGLTDGQTVATWTDMSGNGNNLAATGSAATYKTSVVNGQPVVRFNADGSASFNFTRISTIRTVFWVLKNTNPGLHWLLGDSGSYHFHGDGVLWHATYAHDNIKNGTTRLMGAKINGTVTALPSSSFSLVSLVTTGNVEANTLSIDRGINGRSWAGDMAEVIIYTRELSTAEVLAVNTYLANKYGLVLAQNVPGDIYWDNNGSAAGFGTAAGTWAAPTTGDGSQGWSGDPTGSTLPTDFTTAITNNLRFGSADGGLAAGTVTVSGNVTASNLTFAGSSGGITLTGGMITLADTATIAVDNGGDTISSVLAGAANSLTKQGGGWLTISGKSTVAGDITVSQGVLYTIYGGLRFTSGRVLVSPGASLFVNSGWGTWPTDHEMMNPITLSGTGTGGYGALHGQANFYCNGPITLLTDSKISHDWNNFWLNGAITGADKNLILSAENAPSQPGLWVNGPMSLGSGAITVLGSGYVNLNAAHSFSGGTTVSKGNDGALVLYNSNALGTGGLTVNSGVVDLYYQSISISSLSGIGGRITDNGAAGTTTLTVNQSVDTAFSGVISDGASRVVALTKTGSGTLTLAGANTYMGTTTVSTGTLSVSNNAALGSGLLTMAGGTLAASAGSWTIANTINLASNATIDTGANTLTLAGSITNNGSLTKTGSGTLVLATTPTYVGDTIINGGKLTFGIPCSLINPSFETDAGTANTYWYGSISGWIKTGAANTYIEQGTSTIFAPGFPPNYNATTNYKWGCFQGAHTESQGFSIATAGVYVVSFAAAGRGNGYGPMDIQVQIDGINQSEVITPSTSAWSTHSINVTLSAGSHTLSFVFINALGGDRSSVLDAVSLTGSNLGNFSLPSNNSVHIASGATLDLNGSVQTLASLYGVGTVTNGTLTVTGTVAPGGTNVVGTLAVEGNLVVGPNAVLDWNFSDTTQDLINVTGTLTLPTVATVNVVRVSGTLPLPNLGVLFSAAGEPTINGAANLDQWVIQGDVPGYTRAVVRGNRVQLMHSMGTLIRFL
jgi:autotransporter-associated beta strand protein